MRKNVRVLKAYAKRNNLLVCVSHYKVKFFTNNNGTLKQEESILLINIRWEAIEPNARYFL